MKEFLKKYKGAIIKLLSILLACIAVSCLALLILILFGIVYFDHGMVFNVSLFEKFKNTWYGILVIISFHVFVTTALSFIPAKSAAFTILFQTIFNNPWKAFLITFTGIELSSILMYLIGRLGGYKICKKILGEKDCEKALELLNHKGTIFFPLMMLFPLFPDDALVMLAGTVKMDLKWFIPSIVLGRGIGIATVIFGISVVPFDRFTSFWHWFLFVTICLVLILIVFFLAYRLNKYLEKKREKQDEELNITNEN